MNAVGFVAFSVLGGLMGLDTVSFPQAMLSRPIVAGTLGGAALGSPAAGVLCGATIELFALETLPVGASRYPEWGSASLLAGGLFAMQAADRAGGLLTSVALALLCAYVGSSSMVQLRKLNGRLTRRRREEVARGSRDAVVELQLYGLTADLVRGILLTAVGLAIGAPLQRAVLDTFEGNAALTRAVVVASASAVALGAVWKIFHATPYARWLFTIGLVGGLAVAVAR